jgi:aspartate-semialdehyde dehydrogenase
MPSDLSLAVFGATGAVGREILTVLDRTRWRPERIVAAASPRTTATHVDYGDDNLPVEDARDVDLALVDAAILATPAPAAREWGERAIDEGIPVIDVAGAFRDEPDVPTVVPWINPEALAASGLRGVVSLPEGPALLVASVLGPLARSGIVGPAHATVLVPASHWGRDGIEELSRQVVSLFNTQPPPRAIFPDGLAFDLLPALGEPGEDGWTEVEDRARAQLCALLGADLPVSLTLVGVPVFSGTAANVVLEPARHVLPDLVARILEDGGVKGPEQPGTRHLPRPRRQDGQPFARVGRIRVDGAGRLHLWAAIDAVRAVATASASLVAASFRDRIQAAAED